MSADVFSEWPEGFYMTPTEVDEMLEPFGGDAWQWASGNPIPDYLPCDCCGSNSHNLDSCPQFQREMDSEVMRWADEFGY
jgi:hypothetical protein